MDAETERKIAALEAKIALLKGKTPEGSYKVDIKWYDQKAFKEYLGGVPRTFYCGLVRKQNKSLTEQAATYQIPVDAGSDIDVQRLLIWFHEFVAEWGPRIKKRQLLDEQSFERSTKKEELELQQIELKLRTMAADLEKKCGDAISSDEMERTLSWIEKELRKLGERLGKRFGADAQTLFNSTLDRMSKMLSQEES